MKIQLLVALALMSFPFVAPAATATCDATVTHFVAGHYIQVRPNGSTWVYQETNGVDNLQRGGARPFTGIPESCVDDPIVTPDKLVV